VISVEPVLFVMPALGAAVFEVNTIDSVSVHPFAPVTVTVYVPAEVAVAAALEPRPLFHA
jgi:hypothetical protein